MSTKGAGKINLRNARAYIERFLKIRTKEMRIAPLRLNPPQEKLYRVVKAQHGAGRPIRIIILKARQMGFSTLTEGLIFHRTATGKNVRSLIIAHREDATANLFSMSKRFYDNLPMEIRPMRKASNAQDLVFENPTREALSKQARPGLGSSIRCYTAGGGGIARSDTAQNVHMSEVAFWPGDKKDVFTGIMQAVPDLPETMVIIESTANGYEFFKELWDRAVAEYDAGNRDGFEPVFFAWFEMPEYRRRYDGFSLTAEEERLRDAYGLDLEQLAWRRWCIKNNCAGDLDRFKQEYPASPEEAFIATGACIFDKEAIVLWLRRAPEPVRRGRFLYDYDGRSLSNIRWEDDEAGEITIYEEPGRGVPYVCGGDTAGEGSDWFTGYLIDNVTGAQAAQLRHQYDEDIYARQMYCLGKHYNDALLAPETNFSTYPVKELERLEYTNLYTREREDTFSGGVKKSYGFRTDSLTRPIVLAGLVTMARERLENIRDKELLREMLTFVKNERGRPEAEVGAHDDLVMAAAIAYYARSQQRVTVREEAAPRPVKLIDKLEKGNKRRRRV